MSRGPEYGLRSVTGWNMQCDTESNCIRNVWGKKRNVWTKLDGGAKNADLN